MIVTSAGMKILEGRAFADGVSAEALMEEAGAQMAAAVRQFFPQPGKCAVFFGKGHNGGDALVAARHLAGRGWHLDLRPAFAPVAWSPLTAQKHRELLAAPFCSGEKGGAFLVLDGLLGVGAGGELREPVRAAAREINRLRRQENAHVFALDLPTGLDGDNGTTDPDCVVADFTLTVGFAKRGLVADDATRFTGRLAVLPLADLSARVPEEWGETVATARTLAPLLPRRTFEMHKGECGRVGLVAGSAGLSGAAVLCAHACVRAGAGLVTLYVVPSVYPLIASRTAPEVMVREISSYLDVLDGRHDVLALGPGLGSEREHELLKLLQRAPQPMIVDADALTMLSRRTDLLQRCAGPRLLTPHPGEMARLDAASVRRARRDTVRDYTACFPATLLLKGARTLVGEYGHMLSYNSTGSPGMATGGMGDVLTGVLAALVGQRLKLYDAARLGAWLCGRAAELAIFEGGESEESLTPTHVIAHLGAAFRNLRAGCW